VTIVLQIALTSLEYASSGSITTDVSDCATPICTIAKLNTSFKATDCLTVISVQALTSEIVATADGVVHDIGVCPILAVEWETNEWSGQCSGRR
jgi:hypothetical protein